MSENPNTPGPASGSGLPGVPNTPNTKNIPGALGVGMGGAKLNPKDAVKDPGKALTNAAINKYGTRADGKKNVLGTAGNIAGAAASGAAGANTAGKLGGGQVTGAVAAGLTEALKPSNIKNVMKVVAIFMVPQLVFSFIFMSVLISGFTKGDVKGATTEKASAEVISKVGIDEEVQPIMFNAGQQDGVNWQVLAALWQYQKTHQPVGACDVAPTSTDTTTTTGATSTVTPPADAAYVHPIAGPFSIGSPFGQRFHPVLRIWKLHAGADFPAASGTPLVAVANGVVTDAGFNSGMGNYVKIKLDGTDTVVIYMHLYQTPSVSAGAIVAPGTGIGGIGTTGLSTGDHLHFQVEVSGTPVDPIPWMRAQGIDPSISYTGDITDSTGFGSPCAMDSITTEEDYITDYMLDRDAVTDRILLTEMNIKPEDATDDERAAAEAEADSLEDSETKPTRFISEWIKELIKSGQYPDYTNFSVAMQVNAEEQDKQINPDSDDAKRVREAYTKALAELPVQGMDEQVAGQIFETSLAWYLGKESSSLGSGMVCAPLGGESLTVTSSTTGESFTLTSKQLGYAATAVATAKQHQITEDGQIVMLMTMLQESRMWMYANKTVPASLALPHDKVGEDHDSVGLFQQRVNAGAWGPLEKLMDPGPSTEAFLGVVDWASAPGLLDKFPDQQYGDLGAAAQAVQVSAHPGLYSQWENASKTILGKVEGIPCTGGNSSVNGEAANIDGFEIPAGGCTQCVEAAIRMYKRDKGDFGGDLNYSWGGGDRNGPTMGILNAGFDDREVFGFDCSGLTEYAWWQGAQYPVPSTAHAQWEYLRDRGKTVSSISQLKPGAMVFFGPPNNLTHVAIYMGNNKIVHARNHSVGLDVDDFSPGSYWYGEYVYGANV